jgi:hypothetical protein
MLEQVTQPEELPPAVQAARRTVMDYMHRDGAKRAFLNSFDWCRVYLRGDGFGPVTVERAQRDLEWDWSHVRDSSAAGIEAMHSEILSIIEGRCTPKRYTVRTSHGEFRDMVVPV